MTLVFLTANHGFAAANPGFGGGNAGVIREEREALAISDRYAEQVDYSDEVTTNWGEPSNGGDYRHIRIWAPSDGADQRSALARVIGGYRSAKKHARGGEIALLLGHGGGTPGSAMVDLAPFGLLPVDLAFLGRYERWLAMARSNRLPDAQFETFWDIGDILRSRPRLNRFDLYSCAVGYGPAAQDLLDWMHHLFEVPLRALRGLLEVSGDPLGIRLETELQVLPPPGPLPRRHQFGQRFTNTPIEGRGLWAYSRRRRPQPPRPANP
jgi:hypothetical protein